MTKDDTIISLKKEIVRLHKEISKIYSGKTDTDENIIQLIHKLSCANTEYKRLKSQADI